VSFSDRPGLTFWQQIGCALFLVFTGLVALYLTAEGLFPSSDEPPPPRWQSLLYFPGGIIAALVLWIFLLVYFLRDKD